MPDVDSQFQIPQAAVCGLIPDVQVEVLPGKAEVTSYGGPDGPIPNAFPKNQAAPKLSLVLYGGQLTNGNHFGQCEVIVQGKFAEAGAAAPPPPPPPAGGGGGNALGELFVAAAGVGKALEHLFFGKDEEKKPQSGTFRGTAILKITPPNKPVFDPNLLTVPKGKPGAARQMRILVTPPGSYQVVCRPKDGPEAGLFVQTLVQTDATGSGQCQVQDLIDQARGPLSVKAIISAMSPCVGDDVVSEFSVLVQ